MALTVAGPPRGCWRGSAIMAMAAGRGVVERVGALVWSAGGCGPASESTVLVWVTRTRQVGERETGVSEGGKKACEEGVVAGERR